MLCIAHRTSIHSARHSVCALHTWVRQYFWHIGGILWVFLRLVWQWLRLSLLLLLSSSKEQKIYYSHRSEHIELMRIIMNIKTQRFRTSKKQEKKDKKMNKWTATICASHVFYIFMNILAHFLFFMCRSVYTLNIYYEYEIVLGIECMCARERERERDGKDICSTTATKSFHV